MRSALSLAVSLAVALPAMADEGSWRAPDLDALTMQRLYQGVPAGPFVERRVAARHTEYYTRARAGSGWLCEAERLRLTSVQDRSGRRIRSASVQTVYRAPPPGGCRNLGPGVEYFAAPDSQTANLAADVLHEVIRARRARSRPFFNTECAPGCDFLQTLDRAASDIRSVEHAPAQDPDGAMRIVVRLDGPGSGYEITAIYRPGTDRLRQRIVSATARTLP